MKYELCEGHCRLHCTRFVSSIPTFSKVDLAEEKRQWGSDGVGDHKMAAVANQPTVLSFQTTRVGRH